MYGTSAFTCIMCVESISNEPTSTSCNTYKTYVKQKNKKEPSGMQQLENERKKKKERKNLLSLNSFWWLIYGRVIINFDLVLNIHTTLSSVFLLAHNVKHGSLRRYYLLSTRLNSNQAWPSRCYPGSASTQLDEWANT